MRNPPFPARLHHTNFVSLALPTIVEHHRKDVIGALLGKRANEFLLQVWEDLAELLRTGEERVEPDGLSSSFYKFEKYAIFIITLPSPVCVTEAHFLSIVFGPFENTEPRNRDSIPYRYFVLEASYESDGDDCKTMLCEWYKNEHRNYGSGPQATEAAFLEAVQALIKK